MSKALTQALDEVAEELEARGAIELAAAVDELQASKKFICPKCKKPAVESGWLGWRDCKACGWEEKHPTDLAEAGNNAIASKEWLKKSKIWSALIVQAAVGKLFDHREQDAAQKWVKAQLAKGLKVFIEEAESDSWPLVAAKSLKEAQAWYEKNVPADVRSKLIEIKNASDIK